MSGLPVAATCRRGDVQSESSSLPVESRYGNQADTLQVHAAQRDKEEIKVQIWD